MMSRLQKMSGSLMEFHINKEIIYSFTTECLLADFRFCGYVYGHTERNSKQKIGILLMGIF